MNQGELVPITRADLIAEALRELQMRRRIYPRNVSTGKMDADVAERRIKLMERIAAQLEEDGR
jgi:hypothetical protein